MRKRVDQAELLRNRRWYALRCALRAWQEARRKENTVFGAMYSRQALELWMAEYERYFLATLALERG
jgi:hypothetical protein